MACVARGSIMNQESEMEEGEIVDDIDGLSDISSEEEFLLRQRLQVLENFNKVLERKKAKRSHRTGPRHKISRPLSPLQDLSEISASEFEDSHFPNKNDKDKKTCSIPPKKRKKKEPVNEKKSHKKCKRRFQLKIIPESSEESEDEYRKNRKNLADAVAVDTERNEKSTLSARLREMLHKAVSREPFNNDEHSVSENKTNNTTLSPISPWTTDEKENQMTIASKKIVNNLSKESDDLVLISDDEILTVDSSIPDTIQIIEDTVIDVDKGKDMVDSVVNENKNEHCSENSVRQSEKDSDDDLEVLRQHALKTKSRKSSDMVVLDDEDSDTAELRLICLKSRFLKKAIALKRKQKIQKKLSQSAIQEGLVNSIEETTLKPDFDSNNTDIESVDMDIDCEIISDGDDKEVRESFAKAGKGYHTKSQSNVPTIVIQDENVQKQDDLEEDEDLLRAKLLTSLSKNLPNLVNPKLLDEIEVAAPDTGVPVTNKSIKKICEEKKFIINVAESDSEGENEATRNLTKMHIKLAEKKNFEQRLDLFLKSARREVEKSKSPDIVKEQPGPKQPFKYVPKAVNNLPLSEQIEYKNLVRRMAELEKLKQTRQASMNAVNVTQRKETNQSVLKDSEKNTLGNILEEKISISRKKIAEESAKMMKLREEGTKLSQKYKIVATELRNIATAIVLNKKQQKFIQSSLAKIRQQHQNLIKSSNKTTLNNTKHPNVNANKLSINKFSRNINSNTTNRLQKENSPNKKDYKNSESLKTLKVSIHNDLKESTNPTYPSISIQLDVNSNKKNIIIPNNQNKQRVVSKEISEKDEFEPSKTNKETNICFFDDINNGDKQVVGITENLKQHMHPDDRSKKSRNHDDYRSPLESLESQSNWAADPNAILCPFEVGGDCKDTDCKYLHTKIPTQ